MRVLVMGGTQFNGLALVHELARTGHDVVILNRGKTEADLPHGVDRVVADRTDESQMRDVLGAVDVDAVIDVSAYLPSDVELMIDIFRGRIDHYVFISSTVTYAASELLPITEDHPDERGDDQNAYGQNKLLCEDILRREWRENRFPSTTVALSMVMGAGNIIPDREQRMFQRVLRGRPILVPGNGRTIQQIGHAEDQARALRMVLGQPITFGQRYNLTGGDYFTQEGYVDECASLLGQDVEKLFVPAAMMDALWSGELAVEMPRPETKADIRSSDTEIDTVQMNRFMLSVLVQQIAPHIHRWDRSVFFSVDKLRRHVGWEPELTFRGSLERTWRWYADAGLPDTQEFDFAFEDELIRMVRNWKG